MDQTSELDFPIFLILCGVLGMLLLALAIIVFFMIYQRRLHAQQEDIGKMERDYQKNLLQYSFEAQEAERKRIASDLHDEIGSILSASRIYVHQLTPELPGDNYQELKTETTTLIDQAIDRIRGISHNLFPPNLDHFGLLQAAEDFCNRIQKMNGLELDFEFQEIPTISGQQELALYRILQELVSNTLKHADASRIELRIMMKEGKLIMAYRDNGGGFEIKNKEHSVNGIGMKSIESRVNSIGASFEVKSEPGLGMSFELELQP